MTVRRGGLPYSERRFSMLLPVMRFEGNVVKFVECFMQDSRMRCGSLLNCMSGVAIVCIRLSRLIYQHFLAFPSYICAIDFGSLLFFYLIF